jgi:hypothetical protein
VEANPVNFVDYFGSKKQKPGIYYEWKECNAVEMAQCIATCGDRGVSSCRRRYKIQITIRNGTPTYSYKDLGLSCSCNDFDNPDFPLSSNPNPSLPTIPILPPLFPTCPKVNF